MDGREEVAMPLRVVGLEKDELCPKKKKPKQNKKSNEHTEDFLGP